MEISVSSGVGEEAVLQAAKHIFFVEGNRGSIDKFAISALFEDIDGISVEGMGHCGYVSSVAEALVHYHPTYYFLVDRDAQSDEEVNEAWEKFPELDKNNLLIWKCKEMENYFLSPDFCKHSRYFTGDVDKYIKGLEQVANERVFFDVVNHVIVSVRNQSREKWISCFQGTSKFKDKEMSLNELLSISEYSEKITRDTNLFAKENLTTLFEERLDLLLGGANRCVYGQGRWMELMGGKKIFHQMVNNFFKVPNREGVLVNGRDKELEVVKSLVMLPDEKLPQDFVDLKKLVKGRIKSDTGAKAGTLSI
ncbi:hypothetical protein OCF08_21735 [Bacillus cereus]|nr:hypothetical protein [Bacillus cereus]